jgi:secondary thiamine-phosphate synthase enzyme
VIEHEAGVIVDLEDALERITPESADYRHHLRGYDRNGAAHVRTGLLNASATVPVLGNDMLLGTYQELVVVDMDPERKTREFVVTVVGE